MSDKLTEWVEVEARSKTSSGDDDGWFPLGPPEGPPEGPPTPQHFFNFLPEPHGHGALRLGPITQEPSVPRVSVPGSEVTGTPRPAKKKRKKAQPRMINNMILFALCREIISFFRHYLLTYGIFRAAEGKTGSEPERVPETVLHDSRRPRRPNDAPLVRRTEDDDRARARCLAWRGTPSLTPPNVSAAFRETPEGGPGDGDLVTRRFEGLLLCATK